MTAVSPEAVADASYALGLWTGWGLLHSVLATRRVKGAFEVALGPRYAFYPLAYTLVSLWTFWLVLVKEPDLPQVLWAVEGLPKILLYAAQGAGLAFLAWAGMSMSGLKLLGLSQLWSTVRGRMPEESDIHNDFSTRGAYALARHPMHAGGMLFLLAAPRQTLGGFVFAVFGCLYMLLGSLIEERRLSRELGSVWTDYVRRVPMFLPNLRKH
ncbi:MAG: hypothetical protein P4L39_00370 [Humidesulfovibrio sp.]|nr:hypothetical protein [Humidesulfovibrio sp.]